MFSFNWDRTSIESVVRATAQQVSFCFICDEHFCCQVWRTQLQYFQRYSLFSILPFWLFISWCYFFPNLHNTKMSKWKKRYNFQKGLLNTPQFFISSLLLLVCDSSNVTCKYRKLTGDVSCWGHWVVFLGRHLTLTVPLSTQVYKWVAANLMLGVILQ